MGHWHYDHYSNDEIKSDSNDSVEEQSKLDKEEQELARKKEIEEQELAEKKAREEQPGNHSCQIIPGGYTACGPDDFVVAARQEFTQQAITARNEKLQKASDTASDLAFKTTIATAPSCILGPIAAFVAPPAAVPLGIICATGTSAVLGFEVTSKILSPLNSN